MNGSRYLKEKNQGAYFDVYTSEYRNLQNNEL